MPRWVPAITLVLCGSAGTVYAYSSGPPTDFVRIPWPAEALRDCTSCHNDSFPDFYAGVITLNGLPAEYTPLTTYRLLIDLLDSEPVPPAEPRLRWGFELSAVDAPLTQAGELAAIDGRTSVTPDFGRGNLEFIRQFTPGSLGPPQWEFDWTAPDAGSGVVTFYYCGNAGNGPPLFDPQGDHIFCGSSTVVESACSPLPGPIAGLLGVRQAADIAWSWNYDGAALGGYRLYAVATKVELPVANGDTPSAIRDCPAPTALDLTCVEPGAAAGPGALYYQAVGVCATGLEGPN